MSHGVQVNERTGNTAVVIQFETEQGSIRGYFYLTEKAAEHTCRKLMAIGYQGDDLGEIANGQVMVGMECVIEVQLEVGQDGQQRDRVSFVHPKGWTGNGAGAGVKSSDNAAANIRRFNALWKCVKERGAAANGAGSSEEVPFH